MLRLCDSCLAAVGKNVPSPMSARNFGSGKALPMTRLTHAAYMAREVNHLSPYIAVRGWKLETCTWDFMHNMYLGCGRDILASGLRVMISKGVWGHIGSNDWDTILNAVHMEMHAACAAAGPLNLHKC